MPLRKKLLLAMVIPALLIGIVGGIGIYSLEDLEEAAGRILADNYRSIQAARAMEGAVRDLRALERTEVGDGDIEAIAGAFEAALATCEANVTESDEPAIIARIRTRWEALLARTARTARTDLGARSDDVDALYVDLEALAAINEAAMIRYERETRRIARVMLASVGGSVVLAIAALTVFALVSARRISTPVIEVANRLHDALKPEQSGREPVQTRQTENVDEIARLRTELDALLVRLGRYEEEQHERLSRREEEERRRFISMLSHQLKTPTTSLSMSVNLLREKLTDLSPANEELIAIATDSVNGLSALVSDLIEASREVTPSLGIAPKSVDLGRLLSAALRPLLPQAATHGVTLLLPDANGEVSASVDAVKFPWAATNIAGNALRYTDRGGEIRVAVERASDAIEVTVSDTGSGIAPENVDRIFEPYVSLDAAPGQGTHGLGLAIAREIVVAHGGTISAESTPGVGTRFVIRLPFDVRNVAEGTR